MPRDRAWEQGRRMEARQQSKTLVMRSVATATLAMVMVMVKATVAMVRKLLKLYKRMLGA